MRRKWRLWMVLAMAAALAAAFVHGVSVMAAEGGISAEDARLAEKGESLFQEKCSSCHAIGGGDRSTGPDLQGVTERRDRQWILRMIQDPKSLSDDPQRKALMEQYSMTMPDLGIGEKEAEALYAFLSHPSEEEHAAGEATAPREPAPAAGRPEGGRALYVGQVPLENGGAPCLSCHGFAGIGAGGNAGFAADLTNLYENYGADGVASVLADLPFPTMEPIYADAPLTEEEQADLAAFLKTGAGKQAGEGAGAIWMNLLIGFALVLLATFLFGMKRLRGVRRPLLQTRSHNTEG